MRNLTIQAQRAVFWIAAMLVLGFSGCNEDGISLSTDFSDAEPYDPSRPIEITSFTPDSGGLGQRMVIYGENFGNNPDSIQVYIGGKKAKVIGVLGESIYCLVPRKAFSGAIEIFMGSRQEGEEPLAVADDKFKYQRKTIVSTLTGYKNERDDQGWNPGHFDEASGFRENCIMNYDPLNPDVLYISYDHGPGIYTLDFKDSTVTKLIDGSAVNNQRRLRGVSFTNDGQNMLVGHSQGNNNNPAVSIMSRANGFTDPQVLIRARGNQGVAVHPVDGQLYFSEFQTGTLRRYDVENSQLLGGTLGNKDYEDLFSIQDINWEFYLVIHPSGDYAYIIVINQHYILRTDYDWENKRFKTPFRVAGEPRVAAYADGVGTSARFSTPYSGVFVKNLDYAGTEDEYDFYITDRNNHAIRVLKPDGRVDTYAGRGSSSLDSDPWGYVEGDVRLEARFNQPTGIAYNEAEGTFYIADKQNRCIRKIEAE
ncbi:IPT/TIG domain-containing protein [uncultured Draconibacterium sp.]|uniref:IPT/TIG domain-containing protein n=1 Tax=uncultured Draconibacterium sp. TaxID=1573823 RepID=UPI0029C7D005|nr:IPT/TIG domain-containing protein [uncultured Draconibacterium sp.]